MSAFAAGTGSGSSGVIRRYQRVTGEAGDLGRPHHQPQRPHRSGNFELLPFRMPFDFPVFVQSAGKGTVE